jgi:hypothetical protein
MILLVSVELCCKDLQEDKREISSVDYARREEESWNEYLGLNKRRR